MPVATMAGAGTTAGGTAATQEGPSGQAPAAVVPFIRASQEHGESAGIDVSRAVTTAAQDLGTFDIPAFGYARAIVLTVNTTVAYAVTSGTVTEDAPFAQISNIFLTEPNGATILQFNSGIELAYAMKYGGYRFGNDPRSSPVFVNTLSATGGNFTFVLRLPLEINPRDTLGSLPNQNAAATFKLKVTLAASSAIFSAGTITTQATVRVQADLEAWDQPAQSSELGANQQTPPAVNTTQFWSVQPYVVNAGQQRPRLTRVGNYIRMIVFIFRGATRALGETNWPDPLLIHYDSRPVDRLTLLRFRNRHYENWYYGRAGAANDAAEGRDAGVFVYDYAHEFDGSVGHENRDLWLETMGSTKLEIEGNFGVAGTLTVLTNDVSIAGSVFL